MKLIAILVCDLAIGCRMAERQIPDDWMADIVIPKSESVNA